MFHVISHSEYHRILIIHVLYSYKYRKRDLLNVLHKWNIKFSLT